MPLGPPHPLLGYGRAVSQPSSELQGMGARHGFMLKHAEDPDQEGGSSARMAEVNAAVDAARKGRAA